MHGECPDLRKVPLEEQRRLYSRGHHKVGEALTGIILACMAAMVLIVIVAIVE